MSMAHPTAALETSGPETSAKTALGALRAELDRLDDELQDLLLRRAEIVEQVGRIKGQVALRPGREAAILRRLLARHSGRLPRVGLIRIWRELFAATTAMQGRFVVSACDNDSGRAYVQLAREQFGALTPLRLYHSPLQAIREVSRGAASIAVLPMPSEDEAPGMAWWTALLHRDEPRIHVVARLPFWAPRPEGAAQVQAMVVAAIGPDPSGHDRSLIGLELAADVSRARLAAALGTAGLAPSVVILIRDAQAARALVEVEGFVGDADPRLPAIGSLTRAPVVLGAYAVPLDGEV
jgi:chorismate mutase